MSKTDDHASLELRALSAEEVQDISGGCPVGSLPLIVALIVQKFLGTPAKKA